MKINSALIILGVFVLSGCGDKTVTGPQGPQGNPGPNTIQASFQNGLFPTASYAGETDTWLDGANISTAQYSTSYRRVKVGSGANQYGRVLVKFDVTAIPFNATIETARLLLTTESSTALGSSSVTVGLHDMTASLYTGGCIWNTLATWAGYNGASPWSNCDSDSTPGQQGLYQSPALSTVTFNSVYSSTTKVVEYSIPASIVSSWVSGTNNGLVLISEGEFQNVSTANVDFYPYNASTATNCPQLIVTYE